ncbi:MAG: C13 family peptidase [Candidatus Hodarchaeota archaeon]
MKRKKAIAIVVIIIIIIGLTVGLLLIFLPFGEYIGQRKALICASANDFFGSEPDGDFNGGNDSNLNNGPGNWTYNNIDNSYGDYDFGNGSLSILSLIPGPAVGNYLLNFSEHYSLNNYAFYNMTADVFIQSPHPIGGKGVQIGLIWLDSGRSVVREDWSINVSTKLNQWFTLNITGVCNNETGHEITDLTLALRVNVSNFLPPGDIFYFDNIEIYKWIQVDLNNPTDPPPPPPPPPPGIDSDGFPAQGLQVYWILKNHGYTDDNIFFMLYYKNDADGIIDISLFDAYANDLIHDGVPAIIDVANDSVTASRFKQELNVSYTGSFASGIHQKDTLIIFMCDHGSNKLLPDGNATFHFEADNSFITEFEFYDLVKEIKCQRMMINVDCCFSGNFLNADANIGQSWYDIENCIMVSASSNLLAWYYIHNRNPDGFAGSWFFHWFWDVLDHDGSILDAFNFASTWPPAVRPMPLFAIQNPMWHDNMGINSTLRFGGDPPL